MTFSALHSVPGSLLLVFVSWLGFAACLRVLCAVVGFGAFLACTSFSCVGFLRLVCVYFGLTFAKSTENTRGKAKEGGRRGGEKTLLSVDTI